MEKYKGYEIPTSFIEIRRLQEAEPFYGCRYFVLPMVKEGQTVMYLNTRIDIDDLNTNNSSIQFKICTEVASKAIKYIDLYLEPDDPDKEVKKNSIPFDINIQIDGRHFDSSDEDENYIEFSKKVIAPNIYCVAKYIDGFLKITLPNKLKD